MNQRTSIKWNSYLATAYAEGFCEGANATVQETVEAWAFLIKTGLCWSLQGFFGRTASQMIQNNIISRDGKINWNNVDEVAGDD